MQAIWFCFFGLLFFFFLNKAVDLFKLLYHQCICKLNDSLTL